jgi:hypothetical protein
MSFAIAQADNFPDDNDDTSSLSRSLSLPPIPSHPHSHKHITSGTSTPLASGAITPPFISIGSALVTPPNGLTGSIGPHISSKTKAPPLMLTQRQLDMINNLTSALPDLERVITWFPWEYNSHATLIVR